MRVTEGPADPAPSGIALVVAVIALAVIGTLVTVALFTARSGRHASTLGLAGEAARQAAEGGLDAAAARFERSWFRLDVGGSVEILPTSLGSGRVSYAGRVTRLNSAIWMVRTVGAVLAPDGDTLSVRWVGMLFKRAVPGLDPRAAVTVSGSAMVGGPASLDGADRDPGDGAWPQACAGRAGRSAPGLRAGGAATLTPPGSVAPPAVWGDTVAASTIGAADSAFDELAATADIVTGPDPVVAPQLDATQVCATGPAHPGNWGDPTHRMPAAGGYPCEGYFPVIRFDGPELRLTDAVGQGILLVNGDLRIGSGVSFYGVAVVRGRVVATGGNSEFVGALIARDATLGGGPGSDGPVTFTYSTCAIAAALGSAAGVQPIVRWPFVQY